MADPIGSGEERIGATTDAAACLQMVTAARAHATGMAWSTVDSDSDGLGSCYAEFGSTAYGNLGTSHYSSCIFDWDGTPDNHEPATTVGGGNIAEITDADTVVTTTAMPLTTNLDPGNRDGGTGNTGGGDGSISYGGSGDRMGGSETGGGGGIGNNGMGMGYATEGGSKKGMGGGEGGSGYTGGSKGMGGSAESGKGGSNYTGESGSKGMGGSESGGKGNGSGQGEKGIKGSGSGKGEKSMRVMRAARIGLSKRPRLPCLNGDGTLSSSSRA